MAGEGEGESIDKLEGCFARDLGVAMGLSEVGAGRGGVIDTTLGRGGDKSEEPIGSGTDLINLGKYMEVDRDSVLAGPLFSLTGCEVIEFARTARGKLWTGAEMRRELTEGVDGIRLDDEDGGGTGSLGLGLAGVLSPDRTVVLLLANDAMEEARGFVGLRESSRFKDFHDCRVEREIRVEDSDGAVEDLAGILTRV